MISKYFAAGAISILLAAPCKAAPPQNDAAANAIILPSVSSVRVDGTYRDATIEPGETGVRRSVWYTYVPPTNGLLSLSVVDKVSNSVLAVNVDADPSAGGTTSPFSPIVIQDGVVAHLYVAAGTAYHILVGNASDTEADFNLGLGCDSSLPKKAVFVPPNLNDNFNNAIETSRDSASYVLNVGNSTFEPFEIAKVQEATKLRLNAAPGGVWFKYLSPADGTVIVRAKSASQKSVLLLMGTGKSIDKLKFKEADYNGIVFNAKAGKIYHLYLLSQEDPSVSLKIKLRH